MRLVYFFYFIFIGLSSCSTQNKTLRATTEKEYVITPSGLKYIILKEGTGAPAKEGQEVLIFETTTYLDGIVLYSNENLTSPVKILIGGHQATEGVDEGLRGMRAGEVCKLIAPPYLVKRKSYPPNVSPDSTLMIKMILHKIL
jgi:FKBP-type peptidyl-prolyl cis-trans isomerase